MTNIYQEIWDADQAANGVPALRPTDQKFENRGYVIVDEKNTNVDTQHRVIKEVFIPDSKRESYQLCEALFDNYALPRNVRERVSTSELQEEKDFIDFIVNTPTIQTAREFLELSLNLSISNNTLAAMISETWFFLGRSGSQNDASGFEHVFVGEQGSTQSKIGGYHYWYKYWLDDGGKSVLGNAGSDGIKYLGTQYGGAENPGQGILVPEVITLQLEWEAPLGDVENPSLNSTKRLHKPIGGFFVGPSPEGMIALGLVRTLARNIGKNAHINGSDYQLDLHRLDGNPRSIRTFFPRFLRANVTDILPEPPAPVPAPTPPEPAPTPPEPAPDIPEAPEIPEIDPPPANNDSDEELVTTPANFKILAGMINPFNTEGGREFLQIINTHHQEASLINWQLVAPNGTTFVLSDIKLQAGEVFKFVVPAAHGVLRNKSGKILLKSPDGNTQQICEYSTEQAKNEGAPILFN